MGKKTRIGILEESIDRYRYRMSLHPNFALHYKEGTPVYFETIDIDGKLKRVTCAVEPVKLAEGEEEPPQDRILACKEVYNVVQDSQTDLAAPPSAGKVVYLARKDSPAE